MKMITLRWIIGTALFVLGVTGMVISIATNVTTNKVNNYWSEKNMAKRLKNRKLKMKIIRLFHKG